MILSVLRISASCKINDFVVHAPIVAILAVVARERFPLGRHFKTHKLEQVAACSENKNDDHFFPDE